MTRSDFFLGVMRAPREHRASLLDRYVDAGGRNLDLARIYGTAESDVGSWLTSSGLVGELRILTKGGHPDLAQWSSRLTREEVRHDVEASLDALGVDHVDDYLLHRDDEEMPVEAIAETLGDIVDEGLARRIGVSNWRPDRVAQLVEALTAVGCAPLSWVSNYFGLAAPAAQPPFPGLRAATAKTIDLAGRCGFRVLAWSALSQGYFAGRRVATFESEDNAARRALLRTVARDHGADPTSVLWRWCVTVDPRIVPVFGTADISRLERLMTAAQDAGLQPAVDDLVERMRRGSLGVPASGW